MTTDDDENEYAAEEAAEQEAKPRGPNYITPAGHKKLTDEIEYLGGIDRPRVVREVKDAAAQGDRSENAEYIYGKRRLREIDRRMRFLKKRLDAALIVDPSIDRGAVVYFGATVDIEYEDGARATYQIVGEDEIDASTGRISHRSPIGASLLRKNQGDEVELRTPSGVRVFEIIRVRYL